jgi:superfamily II DNA/RNA helicase
LSIGQDILACAKTGSGKTAAFALPILDALSDDVYGIFALVLTPTRYILLYQQFPMLFFSLSLSLEN